MADSDEKSELLATYLVRVYVYSNGATGRVPTNATLEKLISDAVMTNSIGDGGDYTVRVRAESERIDK